MEQGLGNMVIFKHYSPKAGLSFLDPRYCGSYKAGRERLRSAVKSICLYAEDGEVEKDLFGNCWLYKVAIPKQELYDLSADPLGLLCEDFGLTERRIQRRGFVGYWLPTGLGIFRGQARLFRRWRTLGCTSKKQ